MRMVSVAVALVASSLAGVALAAGNLAGQDPIVVTVDLGTHDADMLCWIAGERPTRVYGEHAQRIHATQEDLLFGLLHFPSGATGMLDVNWLTPAKRRQLTVVGEEGMFELDYLTQRLTFTKADVTHPQLLPFTGDANAAYWTYGDNVNVNHVPFGIMSPHVDPEGKTQQWIVDEFCKYNGRSADNYDASGDPFAVSVPEGMTARAALGAAMRAGYTAQTGYDQSAALIAKWHGRGRLMYAVTPRFAGSSTPEQLEAAGALWRAHPDCLMQTHISENKREVAWMKELFPERRNYLDIYDHHGLVGPRAVFGHGIWLEESELQRLHDGGSAISHCPTSNLFLGSGAFNLRRALDPRRPVRVGIGTDIGAGTSFSILATMGEGYRAALQHQQTLSAEHALYLATRGGARAMYLDDRIGSLTSGLEADIAVLDMKSTPLIAYRMEQARDLGERLFVQMTLGDDRAIQATYVAGRLAYKAGRIARKMYASASSPVDGLVGR